MSTRIKVTRQDGVPVTVNMDLIVMHFPCGDCTGLTYRNGGTLYVTESVANIDRLVDLGSNGWIRWDAAADLPRPLGRVDVALCNGAKWFDVEDKEVPWNWESVIAYRPSGRIR